MKYSQGCYDLGSFAETAAMCTKIFKTKQGSELKHRAMLLKGKAMFHFYQRKMWYIIGKKASKLKPSDRKGILNECFKSMKECISLLGTALDKQVIDQEGSKLLDWAMMDCIRETNRLDQCNRCFLCRCRDASLCKSHIFSKFILKDEAKSIHEQKDADEDDKDDKLFLFGLNKHQLKSAGECWFWLCCKRCESIMTQNAENDFSQLFSSSGSVGYNSWLYNYCCTIIFRALALIKFPRTFNDDEVYQSFLFCRKHLLSLPIKSQDIGASPSDSENYQFQMLSSSSASELKPYLILTPPTMIFKGKKSALPLSFPWLASHRLVDGQRDFAGYAHFFVAYCNGLSILLKFLPSQNCSLPENCLVSPSKGTFIFPCDEDVVSLIPRGLLMLYYLSAHVGFDDITEVLQNVSLTAASKMVSEKKLLANLLVQSHDDEGIHRPEEKRREVSSDSSFQLPSTTTKPRLSLLPPDFNIVPPMIQLPEGHLIILHHIEEERNLSLFLVVDSTQRLYAIFYHNGDIMAYLDGGFISSVSNEICFTKFLLENALVSEARIQLQPVHGAVSEWIKIMLSTNSFFSLEHFLLHVKCHLSVPGPSYLPPIGRKCSAEGCWYCRDLCHCCMKKALPLSSEVNSKSEYRYCSSKCMGMFCIDPEAMQQNTFVIDHRESFKGSSVLEILMISRKDGDCYNTIEHIHLCIGDGSEGLPQREPYVLWQVRSIDFQYYLSFNVTNEGIPYGILWPHLVKFKETLTSMEEAARRLETKLADLLKVSVQTLNCSSVAEYLKKFS